MEMKNKIAANPKRVKVIKIISPITTILSALNQKNFTKKMGGPEG